MHRDQECFQADVVGEEEIPDVSADTTVEIEEGLRSSAVREMRAMMVKLAKGDLAMRIEVWRINRKMAIKASQDSRALSPWRGSIAALQTMGSVCDAVVHLDEGTPGLVTAVCSILNSTEAPIKNPCTPRVVPPPEDDWGRPNLPRVSFHALQVNVGPEYEKLCSEITEELAKRSLGAFSEGSLGVRDKERWLSHMLDWAPDKPANEPTSPKSPKRP